MSKHTGHKSEHPKKQQKTNWGLIIGIVVIAIVVVFLLIWPSLWPSIKPVGEIKMPAEYARPVDKVPAGETAAGDPAAPIKLEIYADYQCPACAFYASEIDPLIISNYVETGKVYLVHRAYSFLDQGTTLKESHKAAEASFCAMDQNAFWRYHDVIYANLTGENVGDFVEKRLIAFAEKLGLDTAVFEDCLKNRKYSQRVEDEIQLSKDAGVNKTPSFFIDGQLFNLQTSYNELFQALDNAIAAKRQ